MRALVLKQVGQDPEVDDFEVPTAGPNEQIVDIIAAGLNPYDRTLSNSSDTKVPRVVGLEAVVRGPDGKRYYCNGFVAPYGAVAEKALVKSDRLIELPDQIPDGQAVAVGIAGRAAWLPLSWQAKLQPGESVLILGATGVQGQIAVQAARQLGAGQVVAAGRNEAVLNDLKSKGADRIVVLDGDEVSQKLKAAAPDGKYQVVIDSLYGQPLEALLSSGALDENSRVVCVGASAGPELGLDFRTFQATKGAQLSAYSTFYVPADLQLEAHHKLVDQAMAGNIQVDVQEFPLQDAAQAWQAQAGAPHGKIIVTV